MADFEAITTQEEFDKAIQKRLAQKEREVTERFKDFISPDDMAKKSAEHESVITKMSEELKAAQEKLAGHDAEVSDLKQRAERAETTILKSKVAHENGVPIELADRLIGGTEDELKADAEKIAGFLRPASAPPARSTEPPVATKENAQLAALAGMIPSLMPAQN